MSVNLFKIRRTRPGRSWRCRLAGVTAVVAALALAPAASANGWSLQSVPNEPFTTIDGLSGVSCSSTANCFAVGFDTEGGQEGFLVEHYNGSSWAVQTFAGPSGTSSSGLQGVSCPTASFCMAVGEYTPAGDGELPLVFTYNGSSWTQQNLPLTASEHVDLSGVSCTSATFCMAVGGFPGDTTTAWSWNGSSFTQQRTSGFPPADFTSVSCTSSTFCMAAGWASLALAPGLVDPFTETYNGSSWSIPNGALNPDNGNATNSLLTGVACVSTSDCQAAGRYFANSSGPFTFGLSYNGSTWTQQSTPPTGTHAAFGNAGAVACAGASLCWAVGDYTQSSGTQQVLADYWGGSSWELATLPDPSGTNPSLQAVACPTSSDCEAVGSYVNTSGRLAPFAEQYTFTFSFPCCSTFTPHHFALSVRGVERHGATITAVLHKPRTLTLLVQAVRNGRQIIDGLVPLGSHPAGTSKIHWNLRVNGRLLGKGTYKVSLHSVTGDVLSPATPPGEITLTVKANRRVHVGK